MTRIARAAPPAGLTPEALDARREAGEPFPVVDPERCTFAFSGPAISVRLVHFGVGFPDDLSFERVGESGWWLLSLAVPSGSRLEYKLEVVDSYGTHLVGDPLNCHEASHPFGANSVCAANGYAEPAWAQSHPDVAPGQLTDFTVDSSALARTATLSLYLPPGFSTTPDEPYPLVVVHDGSDYLRYAAASTVLDNLIGAGSIPPTVVAFIHPGERLVEYGDDPRHAEFLTAELVPRLESELPLLAEPAGRCLMGASFGAVASLSAAWRAPGNFGRLVLQSGSFAGAGAGCRPRPEPLWHPVRRFVQDYLCDPIAVAGRVFVSCGAYESLICENRALAPVLGATGMSVRFVESLDGHNWACWRDTLGLALPWLLDAGSRPSAGSVGIN